MSQNPEQLFLQWSQNRSALRPTEQAKLLALGLDIFRPVMPIDHSQIQAAIDFSNIETVFSTESTQKHVKSNSTLIAEHQSAGTGQRGKSWLTPLGLSICLSHRFVLDVPLSQMAGYTLTVALACLQSIKHFDTDAAVAIKWPNDLYCHGVKFAGILTQAQAVNDKQSEITLGIGINWQLGPQHFAQIDQTVCNIPLNTGKISRNQFIIVLLKQINQNNHRFSRHGFSAFTEQWQQYDQLRGQTITLTTAKQQHTGSYAGISALGEIQIQCDGELKRFTNGEAQILKN